MHMQVHPLVAPLSVITEEAYMISLNRNLILGSGSSYGSKKKSFELRTNENFYISSCGYQEKALQEYRIYHIINI